MKPWQSAQRFENIRRLTVRLASFGITVAGPLPTQSGQLICRVFDRPGREIFGYLQPWLEGRHVNLSPPEERLAMIRAVCRFHQAGMQVSDAEVAVRPSLLSLRLDRKLALLDEYWPQLSRRFPELAPLKHTLFARATDATAAAKDERALHESGIRPWCHRDLAPHNLMWDGASVGFIDFDLAAPDDPLGDAVQLCNHALFLEAVGQHDWRDMVFHFSDAAALSFADAARLWRLLSFPDALARLVTEWHRTGTVPETDAVLRAIDCEQTRMNWLSP